MGSLCCIFEIFSKFNTGEALNIFGGILIDVVNSGSGNSLNRISALGADSEAMASSLNHYQPHLLIYPQKY